MLMILERAAPIHADLDVAQLKMNCDLIRVDQWLAKNRMIPNVKKTNYMVIGSRQALKRAKKIRTYLDNEMLDELSRHIRLSWSSH